MQNAMTQSNATHTVQFTVVSDAKPFKLKAKLKIKLRRSIETFKLPNRLQNLTG